MKKIKVTIVSIFPKYSALWKYGFFLKKELSKNKKYTIQFLDLWKQKKYHNPVARASALLKGIPIEKTDVLILVAPILCKSLKKSQAKLKITIVHDLYPLKIRKDVPSVVTGLTRMTYKDMKHSDIILPVSNFCKSEIKEKYDSSQKLIKVNGSIDHSAFRILKKSKKELRKKLKLPNKRLLLHVGRDEHRKNFEFVLKLLNTLKDNTVLVKIGDISKSNTVFIKRNKLEKNIIVLKDIDEKKLCEVYNASDVLVFPSSYEGLGLPPIEAMACGLPVLAGNNTGLKEACIPDSLLPLQINTWLRKINHILKNKKTRTSMIKKGISHSKKFDWKTYAQSVNKIIIKSF